MSSASLTPAEFQIAVAKGLGRALFAVRESAPGTYDDLIVESCLFDQQESRYCDALRFPYQMRLIQAAGIEERALEALLSGMRTSTHTGELAWMTANLAGYAQRGHEEAYRTIQERAAEGDDWAQQILAHTGDRGLEWLIENVLPGLLATNDGSYYQWYHRDETTRFTPAQRRLKSILDEDEAERDEAFEDSPQGPLLTPRAYLDAFRASKLPDGARSDFREEATDDEYRELIELWMADPSETVGLKLRGTVRRRPFPLPFSRLLEFGETERGKPRLDRFLAAMSHPDVRAYALRRLQARPIDYGALWCFRHSFKRGDVEAIRAVLPQIASQDRLSRFGFTFGLHDLMETYADIDWQPFAEWMYEHADDSYMRRNAVQWMVQYGTIPPAILEEGVEDAEPVVRRICRKATKAAG